MVNAGYPYTPAGGSGDAITAAPLYYSGVLAGRIDEGEALLPRSQHRGRRPRFRSSGEYDFGPSESVSGVGFDPTVNRYMVTTANASTDDGRLYYFDLIADPTPTSL